MDETQRTQVGNDLRQFDADALKSNGAVISVATAIRKLAHAASPGLGRDCMTHAVLCQEALRRLGIETSLRAGFAAWRVGQGDGDVISHVPVQGQTYPDGAKPVHCWLELGDGSNKVLLDFTTYQLRLKAKLLDEMDGGNTAVDWCPDYLITTYREVATFHEVIRGDAGLYYYESVPLVESMLLASRPDIDEEDVLALLFIAKNPDMQVRGPSDCF